MPPYDAETAARVLFDSTGTMLRNLSAALGVGGVGGLVEASPSDPPCALGSALRCRFCGLQVGWLSQRSGLVDDEGAAATSRFYDHLRQVHYAEVLQNGTNRER